MKHNSPASTTSPSTSLAQPHRSKAVAGALALFLGWAGAHRLYLGSRFWWLYPLFAIPTMVIALVVNGEFWYRHPGFFIAAAVALVAMFESILICLTSDEKWDGRRNADSAVVSSSGWAVVLIAIAALMIGAILMMSVMAIALEAFFESIRTSRM